MFFLSACLTEGRLGYLNMAETYANPTHFLIMTPVLFHETDSSSVLKISLHTEYLRYKKQKSSEYPLAQYTLSYRVYPDMESWRILDSASIFGVDSLFYGTKVTFQHECKIHGTHLRQGVVNIELRDMVSQKSYSQCLNFSRDSAIGPQDIMLINEDSVPVSPIQISTGENIRLYSRNRLPFVNASCYRTSAGVAAPPFSEVSRKPEYWVRDSSYLIPFEGKYSAGFSIPSHHLLAIGADIEHPITTIIAHNPDFPEITNDSDLLAPMQYILTRSEYNEIWKSADRKTEIDKFWLRLAGSTDRARIMIKSYFQRVKEANIMFSDDRDGWRTDRGMIYIVLGPPTKVYIASRQEKWIYGGEQSAYNNSFYFNKIACGLSMYRMELERDPALKFIWYQAVDAWRR